MRKLLLVALAFSMSAGTFAFADDNNKDKEVDEALATFRKAYASKEESERVSAISALGQVQNKKVIDLLAHGLKDSAPAVRREAAKAIGGIWAKEAAPTLVKALNLDDTAKDVQVAIINALGETQSDAAVPSLLSVLQPKRRGQATDDPYTGPALDALRKIGSALATDDLITFLTQESAGQGRGGGRRGGGGGGGNKGQSDEYTRQAEAALKNITGQSHSNAADWRKWWNDNKDTLKKIQVHRCIGTGKAFDHVNSSTKCPNDGDQHPSCGYFLKTRFEAGGLGSGEDTKSSSDDKKPKGNRNKNNNNGGNGGNNN